MNNFQQRLILGSLATVFSFLLLWYSSVPVFRPLFALIIASIITLASAEFYHLGQGKNHQPIVKIGLLGCFFYPLAVFTGIQFPQAEFLPLTVLILTLFGAFFYFLKNGLEPLKNLSLTLFALVYIAIPLSLWLNIAYLFPINTLQEGRWWLLYLLAVTKMTDIGAYLVGNLTGKHKMAPTISPGKSWEGAIGGLFIGMGTSVIFYLFQSKIPLQITLVQSIVLGIILSIIGQLGDLAESLLKRDAGIKNSSQIPGLGGILDMVDSLIFTTPLLYIFLKAQTFFT